MRERLGPIELDNYKPLRELVFESLREAIIQGRLHPGERLMEVPLAEELGVSRTPVREAIRMLELERLVVIVPRKGAYVAGVSIKDILDIFEIRGALEGLAAALAAERITAEELDRMERLLMKIVDYGEKGDIEAVIQADTEFHAILFEAADNERLTQIVSNLREQIQRFRATSLTYPGRITAAHREHRGIVEALTQRDGEAARQLAQEHIENAENSLMESLQETED